MTIRNGLMRVLPAVVLAAATMVGGAGSAGARGVISQRASAPAVSPGALTVTPNAGLVDNQTITIGTVGGADTYVICPTSLAADPDQCTYLNTQTAGMSSATVKIPARIVVRQTDGTVAFVDCRTTSCTVEAVSYPMDAGGPVVLASAVVTFNPAGALRTPPLLTATPHTNLVDGQQVNVSVTPAGDPDTLDGTVVLQCTAPISSLTDLIGASSSCSFDTMANLTGPTGGTAVGTVALRAFISTPTGPVDCRATTSTCVLFTYDQVFQTSNVPLTFDATGPVEPAFLTRPLVGPFDPNNPPITTTFDLVGFTPGEPFTIHWCNADGACLPGVIISGTLDANGIATFGLDNPFPDDAPDGFCSQWCSMQATDAHGLTALGGGQYWIFPPEPNPGSFHSKRLPVQVTPNKGLHDGDTVTVTASGFAPGASVAIIECNSSAVADGIDACDVNTSTLLKGTDVIADAQGNVTATYAITQHISTPKDGPLDCATSNVDPDAYNAGIAADPSRASITAPGYFTCMIVVADTSDYQQSGGTPFAFEGAKFRRLPWQVDPPVTVPLHAAPATPISAQPTFTG